jgi:hypothetical protein
LAIAVEGPHVDSVDANVAVSEVGRVGGAVTAERISMSGGDGTKGAII